MFTFNTLKIYILKVFDLKEDELKKTLLLQLNIFLLITTLLIVKPTINSLFLSELTSSALPLGYVLTAIMAIVGSYFYDKILERKPLNKVIEGTIIGAVVSLIIFGIAFTFNLAGGLILYIPYIWVAIFGLLTASQFWILANLVYNVREAKRVFGFIGAGAIAGGIFGGYLTSLLTTFLRTESLLFVAAILLACCLPIVKYIWKNEVVHLSNFQVSYRSTPKGDSPLKLIKQSKLLSLIAIVIGLSVLVAKLVDYQYSDYASRLITDPEKLTSFFGFWFSTLSVISLLVQLFLTQRIVGTFGVGKSLFWLPSGILMGSFLLLFLPQLWVIIGIKVVDGSLKQSVNKAATELLSIPIPIETKKKTKTFTDVVVDSIATGLAGFILIFFINGLNISSTYISLIIIALISLWIFFIYHLRLEYIISFKDLLDTSHTKKEKIVKKCSKKINYFQNSIDAIEILPKKQWFKNFESIWSPDEKSALIELQNFIKNRIVNYSDNRNFPNIVGTSKLSPFIKFGQIHVETIWKECTNAKKKTIGTSKFLTEIGWREFNHTLINHFPHMLKNNYSKNIY